MIHLDKQFVERINLIGITVGQKFLHVVEKQDATLGLLDIIVPLIHEALIVNSIDHCKFLLRNNLVLIKIIPDNLRKHRLSSTRFTHYYGVDAKSHVGNVLTRMKKRIGIDNRLELLFHLIKTDYLTQYVLRCKSMSTPATVLGYRAVFLMTMFTFH